MYTAVAIFSDFRHFLAGPADFKLAVVKCVCSTFKSDAHHSAGFTGGIRSLPFQNQTLKSVTLCFKQSWPGVLIPS